ncbi:immunoglobulin superfamily containing leucine-rich repeat protein-like [Synchiropus splendidus]|uniref:immunoglobulin superfamily containing leucine-rich repeat protein-like n=1 Tax=Synchiropus splendidus TaxID=270530 RepID=UPI00237D525C|nr:immunoglobulin superfamily containing leucine-rich repeat protein-like [Synchiropus splendidus]
MADIVIIAIWILAFVRSLSGCPDRCSCTRVGGSFYVECAHQDFSEVPAGVPPEATILGLSANKLTLLPQGSFDNTTLLTSLWMAHNRIVVIESGTLAPLVGLRNLDVSHNKIVDFPWVDLRNLTSLQQLKLTNNEMVTLPKDAFVNLQRLRSLCLNNNRFFTIAEGTFDSLLSLKHLQLFINPFLCDCSLYWLREWMSNTTVSVPEQNLITCAGPIELEGMLVGQMPQLSCLAPHITISPDINHAVLLQGDELMMTCKGEGNPPPTVTWHIHSQTRRQGNRDAVQVFDNGTLLVPHLTDHHSANYSCTAKNSFGEAKRSVSVEVKPTFIHRNFTNTDDALSDAPWGEFSEQQPQNWSRKCNATRNTRYVSYDVLNASFDGLLAFGTISLIVSETDVTVRLDPLHMHRSKHLENPEGSDESSEIIHRLQRLYVCAAAAQKHLSVQWTRIRPGISTYKFDDLIPGSNYSLCVTDSQDDCKVLILFTTGRRAPNLLVIISVSIGLLTVATIPLIVAVCYHLAYKYHHWTRNLNLKAKDQYVAELNMHFNAHASRTESQSNIIGSQLEMEGSESRDKEKEEDSEETVSSHPSRYRENFDKCELESENSDKLPLGAEALSIIAHRDSTNQ